MESVTEATVRRQRMTQLTLLLIILATIPCYCVGGVLWVYRPQHSATPTVTTYTPTATLTLVGSPTWTVTPFFTATLFIPLGPTPTQFRLFTLAPTRTSSPLPPFFTPTNTPIVIIPPTLTPIILPTSTPHPTSTPITPTSTTAPTSTPVPTSTPAPTSTPPPTLTPTPTLSPTPTSSPTPTLTPSTTLTPTITSTPSNTPTKTPTSTATP